MPAWACSFAFHVTIIVMFALTVHPMPQVGSGFGGASTTIMLNTGADGGGNNWFDGEDASSTSTEMVLPGGEFQAADILSALPEEPVAPSGISKKTPLMHTVSANTIAQTGGTSNQSAELGQGGNGGGSGSPSGRGSALVSVFGVQGEGNKFVYLFDRSSSMEGAPLAAAKKQLLDSLASLGGAHQFQIIFFNTKVHPFNGAERGRIAYATDPNKQLAANFVGGVTADGGTDRLTALKEAIRLAPDVIFFLTDADDPMSLGELGEIDRENSRTKAAICVIEFGRRQSPSPGNFLAELARQSGGQYGYVNTLTLTAGQ